MDELEVYVDKLKRSTGYNEIPQFSQKDGRTKAKILFLHRDPGNSGASMTGVVDRDNPKITAKNFREANEKVGLDREQTIAWNIVPWPVGERAIAPQVEAALPWLGNLIELLPKLRVVALLGNDARRATRLLYLCHPNLHVLHGPHPRLWGNKPQDRAWLEATVCKARCLIQSSE